MNIKKLIGMKYLINIIFLLVLFLFACGSRKTSVQKEEIKIEQTTTVKEELSQVSEKIETLIDTSLIVEHFFEPIDTTKPMVIDKKNGIFKNTKFKTKKTKNGITTSKKEESVLNQRKDSLNEMSMYIDNKDKKANRENNGLFWFSIILIIFVSWLISKEKNK